MKPAWRNASDRWRRRKPDTSISVLEQKMQAEHSWFYLQNSRQIGPCTWTELQDLLSINVISPATLVWRSKGGGWRTIEEVARGPRPAPPVPRQSSWMLVIGAVIFCAAMFVGADVSTRIGSEQTNIDFFPLSTSQSSDEPPILLMTIGPVPSQPKTETSTILVEPSFSQAPSATPWTSRPRAIATSPSRPTPNSHLVQEYWRAISHSKVIGRYEYYLRRAPTGSFARGAATRIEELKRQPRSNTTNRVKKPPPKKQTTSSSMPANLVETTPDASAERCWSRNREACRQKCRAGDHRSCERLRRLGG
jgi:hypothetical protein